jgi:hypothetical protein
MQAPGVTWPEYYVARLSHRRGEKIKNMKLLLMSYFIPIYHYLLIFIFNYELHSEMKIGVVVQIFASGA